MLSWFEINIDSVSGGDEFSFTFPIDVSESLAPKTLIEKIRIHTNFKESKKMMITGGFKPSKTRLLNGGNYLIELELTVNTNKGLLPETANKIEPVIVHEINHAFGYINKINSNKKKSVVYNSVRRNLINMDEIVKAPELKEFLKMFYLSLPEEISARVQQTYSEMKYLESEDFNEMMEELLQYNPLSDAKMMMGYKCNNILKNVDADALVKFVNEFNREVSMFSKQKGMDIDDFKVIDKPGEFFKHWQNIINWGGNKLFRKIAKVVANKNNINEGTETIMAFDEDLFDEITCGMFRLE